MSAGPITAKPLPRGEAVCATSQVTGHGYCGLTKPKERVTSDWGRVTCPECQAARRADEAVS